MGFISPKEQEKPDMGPTTRRPGECDIWQISHAMAHFVVPHFAFKNLAKMIDLWVQSPRTCPTFFYLTTCQLKKVDSVTEEATRFSAHTGPLTETHDFYLLEHPKPPAVDVTQMRAEELASGKAKVLLAPYFSVAAVERNTKAVRFFVLGQAPAGGGCVVHEINAEGKTRILATGPKADAGNFLQFIRARLTGAPTA